MHAHRGAIEVPDDIAELRRTDPKRAREIQKEVGERFQEHFRHGPGRDRL